MKKLRETINLTEYEEGKDNIGIMKWLQTKDNHVFYRTNMIYSF